MPTFVYLLRSVETPNSVRCYVGFTPRPRRRLRQHNGEIKGGADKTKKHRPWEHVCIVGGFPNKYVAYMFEHQWQSCVGHHDPSRILKDALVGLDYKGKGWKGQLIVLLTMLQQPLWSQLSLDLNFISMQHLNYYESIQKQQRKVHNTCRFLAAEDVDELHLDPTRNKSLIGSAIATIVSAAATASASSSLSQCIIRCQCCNNNIFDANSPAEEIFCCNACENYCHLTCLADHTLQLLSSYSASIAANGTENERKYYFQSQPNAEIMQNVEKLLANESAITSTGTSTLLISQPDSSLFCPCRNCGSSILRRSLGGMVFSLSAVTARLESGIGMGTGMGTGMGKDESSDDGSDDDSDTGTGMGIEIDLTQCS